MSKRDAGVRYIPPGILGPSGIAKESRYIDKTPTKSFTVLTLSHKLSQQHNMSHTIRVYRRRFKQLTEDPRTMFVRRS